MNRNLLIIGLAFLLGMLAPWAIAQETDPATETAGRGQGICQFIDEDGDGFNDLAPDADGDGIPNGLDPDYVKPEDGTGQQFRWGMLGELFGFGFGGPAEAGMGNGHMYGPGDGSGGTGPADGTGFGPGTGVNPGDGGGQGGPNGPVSQDGTSGRRGERG